MSELFCNLIHEIDSISEIEIKGKVSTVRGMVIEATGIAGIVSIGSRCIVVTRDNSQIKCEVIGINNKTTSLLPFSDTSGVGQGCDAIVGKVHNQIFPDKSWLGRVIDAFGNPIDNKGALGTGSQAYNIKNSPPLAHKRQRVGGKIDTGVRAIDSFLSYCSGQRMGVFSGSGVGKSMLISMLTKFADIEVKVIGLVGERGREVQEFLEDYLGEEGLKQAVIIVATADEAALARRQAAYITLTVSEYFRDQGVEVLCMVDSITRFAMAQREIGLAAGEPPTTKGYPPSVFAELPKLLERAGPGECGSGNITGLFSVLVEGDDHNEPISDAVRGILDGHIVLERKIAQRGRYPAINILQSISRMLPKCNNVRENEIVNNARNLLSAYNEMEDLIKIGAYKHNSDAMIDNAIICYPKIEAFLGQNHDEKDSIKNVYKKLAQCLE